MARSHSIHVLMHGTKVVRAFTVKWELEHWWKNGCTDPAKHEYHVLRCGDGLMADEPERMELAMYVDL